MRSFDTMPWVIIDPKEDDNIAKIERAEELDVTDKLPEHPGIYVMHPHPGQEDEVNELFWKLWGHRDIGFWLDEGLQFDKKQDDGLRTVLTQGRSRHVPAIILTQRPVDLTRYAFTQSEFIEVMRLNDARERKTVEFFVPLDSNMIPAEYRSYYYDVGNDKLWYMKPAPKESETLERINAKLPKKRRWI